MTCKNFCTPANNNSNSSLCYSPE